MFSLTLKISPVYISVFSKSFSNINIDPKLYKDLSTFFSKQFYHTFPHLIDVLNKTFTFHQWISEITYAYKTTLKNVNTSFIYVLI